MGVRCNRVAAALLTRDTSIVMSSLVLLAVEKASVSVAEEEVIVAVVVVGEAVGVAAGVAGVVVMVVVAVVVVLVAAVVVVVVVVALALVVMLHVCFVQRPTRTHSTRVCAKSLMIQCLRTL